MIDSTPAPPSRFSSPSSRKQREKQDQVHTCRLTELLVPIELVISFSNDVLVCSTGTSSTGFALCGDGGISSSLNTNRLFDTNTVDVLRARPGIASRLAPLFLVGDGGCLLLLRSAASRNPISQLLLLLSLRLLRPSTSLILLLNSRSKMFA